MSDTPHGADLDDVIPSNCHDILVLADAALERYWAAPTILNLYPMALLTSHVADWYVSSDLGLRPSRKRWAEILDEFASAYPQWNAIRDAGNGLKHAKVQAVSSDQFFTEDMMFEHPNWWSGEAYGVPYQGAMAPVDRLCFEFLREFREDLTTGRLKDRLPKLHAPMG